MKRKLLIGVLVFLGIVVALLNPLAGVVAAIGVWVYLFIEFRKQETHVSGHYSQWLKFLMVAAAFSVVVFVAAAIIHNVKYGLTHLEEPLYLIIALAASWVFVLTTAGALAIFLKSRQ